MALEGAGEADPAVPLLRAASFAGLGNEAAALRALAALEAAEGWEDAAALFRLVLLYGLGRNEEAAALGLQEAEGGIFDVPQALLVIGGILEGSPALASEAAAFWRAAEDRHPGDYLIIGHARAYEAGRAPPLLAAPGAARDDGGASLAAELLLQLGEIQGALRPPARARAGQRCPRAVARPLQPVGRLPPRSPVGGGGRCERGAARLGRSCPGLALRLAGRGCAARACSCAKSGRRKLRPSWKPCPTPTATSPGPSCSATFIATASLGTKPSPPTTAPSPSTPSEGEGLWRLLFWRGIAHERAGRWTEAERDFEAALALNGEQADVLNYLAYSWTEQGAPPPARPLHAGAGPRPRARSGPHHRLARLGALPPRRIRPGDAASGRGRELPPQRLGRQRPPRRRLLAHGTQARSPRTMAAGLGGGATTPRARTTWSGS